MKKTEPSPVSLIPWSQRPSSRPMAEYRGFDPDRNPLDISHDKGYEIEH
jgi:hypothetical protein